LEKSVVVADSEVVEWKVVVDLGAEGSEVEMDSEVVVDSAVVDSGAEGSVVGLGVVGSVVVVEAEVVGSARCA
jgi:hypothetical protein